MKNVIYLDILIAVNLFVTYFLLLATALLLHRKPRRRRLALGAAAGGLSSFLIFLDGLGWLLPALLKLALGALLVRIAFPWEGRGVYLKTALLFAGVNFLFAGTMLALWLFAAPAQMYYRNGVVYFNVSALTLAVSTVVAYLAIRLIGRLFAKRVARSSLREIRLSLDGKETMLTAFEDSGNRLTDPLSGTPVVICRYAAVKSLLPQAVQGYFAGEEELPRATGSWSRRIRVVPYHVVGNNGLLRCFVPDRFQVIGEDGSLERKVLIGVDAEALSGGEYAALLNAALFSN